MATATMRRLRKLRLEGYKRAPSLQRSRKPVQLHILIVLHRVLYPKAHVNGFEKKKNALRDYRERWQNEHFAAPSVPEASSLGVAAMSVVGLKGNQ